MENNDLLNCIEKDVMSVVLETKDVSKALEHLNSLEGRELTDKRTALINESIRKKLRILRGEYGVEESRGRKPTNFLTVFLGVDKQEEEIGADEEIDRLIPDMTLRGASYLVSHYKNIKKKTKFFRITHSEDALTYLATINEAYLQGRYADLMREKAFYERHSMCLSEYGAPIVRRLKPTPIPRVIVVEDDGCIYIDFWLLGSEKSYFDANEGDYKAIQPRNQILCRIYPNLALLEIQLVSSDDYNVQQALGYIRMLLGDEVGFQKIDSVSEGQFREIGPFVIPTNEKHEGTYSSTTIASNNKREHVASDRLYPTINGRPYFRLNGTVHLVAVGKPAMISIDKKGGFTIKTELLSPEQRKIIIRWVWEYLR